MRRVLDPRGTSALNSNRFTIGQVMVAIAALAGLMAVPRIAMSSERIVLDCLIGLFIVVIVLNKLIETMLGKPCPSCSRWSLHRLARHPHYYRCSECGGRFKRFGMGPWFDASGPEDEARYCKRSQAGQWQGFMAPRDLDATTSGRLLKNKRTLDLEGEARNHPHPPTHHHQLEQAELKARDVLNHLRQWQE